MGFNPDDPRFVLQRDVERLLRNLVYQGHPASHFSEPAWAPPVDWVAGEHSARVIVELAGVPREDVHVTLQGRLLEIRGVRRPPGENGEAHYHCAEILFGEFHRVVELPWEADPQSVDARYRDGLLDIQIVRVGSTVGRSGAK